MIPWFMYIVCVVIVVIIVDRNPLWNKLGYPAYLTVICVDAPG